MPSAAALRDVLPTGSERAASGYVVDGAAPQLAQRPRTREDVATLLASAAAAGLGVTPQGGRTALALGRPLDRYEVALDMRGLDRIVAYEPRDLTVTAEAGVALSELQARLAEHGQYLPVDPPPDERVTVGGLLATARPGAWRGHLPTARDLVLGMQVVLPDGTFARSGGRVVKNVSGYDLHRLHTGALGSLGVIIEASFKLAPLPRATRSLAVRCASLEGAAGLAFALRDAVLPARALSVLAPEAAVEAGLPDAAHALVELAGYEAAIEASAKQVASLASDARAGVEEAPPGLWERLRALAGDGGAIRGEVVLRLGVPATALGATIEAARELGATVWGHLAAGSVLVRAPALEARAVGALRDRAEALRGFLVIESGPPGLRSAVDPLGAGERELVRALKQQFDPGGTLNPGRWEAGL
jgi:glycolate oxidase FAD binding subunit